MWLSSFNQAVILILISERIGYNILQMKIWIQFGLSGCQQQYSGDEAL